MNQPKKITSKILHIIKILLMVGIEEVNVQGDILPEIPVFGYV